MPHKGLEARREHDFHRYLDAVLSLSGSVPTYCDLNDPAAVEAHDPVPSPDTALTAFCQLAALRLKTKRALLFFFDVTHAFILAEATRNLSLSAEEVVHHTEDPLWLGFTAIPRGFSVCEHTISIVAPPLSAACSSQPVNVISDLSEDTRFCGRPYVRGAPNARFYAGVPITSPEGINIGAFCVLDDSKRDGLDDAETEFMRDISATIMTHLTLVRAKAEQKRETRMVTALGRFVQDSSGLRETNQLVEDENSPPGRRLSSVRTTTEDKINDQAVPTPFRPSNTQDERRPSSDLQQESSPLERAQMPHSDSRQPAKDLPACGLRDSASSRASSVYQESAATRSIVDDLRKEAIPTNIHSTFERAASQVRDAIGVDGVVFLDASIGTFGGLTQARHPVSRRGSEATFLAHDPVLWSRRGSIAAPKTCYVLGSSLSYDMTFDAAETNITEPLLESLLYRYPTGKIWTFEGQGSDCEDVVTDSATEGSPIHKKRPPMSRGVAYERWEKRTHADEIQRLFPRVRSFGFVGMWDHVHQRFFAGCIFWTSSPFRVLSIESELRYISAFCDVIMTETKRLEAERSDKAKMDFLSSISHELRSPLHGILGSTECLQEQDYNLDVAAEVLVSQIESCGRTLLDIIDHLLEYSRINFSTGPAARLEDRPDTASPFEAKQLQHLGQADSGHTDIALDAITEDVIDAAVFSFFSGRNTSDKDDLSIMIDIDSPGSNKWRCRIASGGWKRICMNIVTNALKYTSDGYIHIGLQTTLIPNSGDQLAAVLTVSDTGKGMTKEFLKNHLFRAFAQEDCLASGIGLGMNLVAKIVQTFGGKIDVQSQHGNGTRVTVFMPLQQPGFGQGVMMSPGVNSRLWKYTGKSVCVVSAPGAVSQQPLGTNTTRQASEIKAHSLLITTLDKACGQFGLSVCRFSPSKSCTYQFSITTERDLMEMTQDPGGKDTITSLGQRPLIVICKNSQSARKLRKSRACLIAGQVVEYLAQPCGPAKLDKAIAVCLTRQPTTAGVQGPKVEAPDNVHQVTDPLRPDRHTLLITALPSRPASPIIKPTNDGLILLLVDDNPINLQLLKTYAGKRGLPRLVASNGLEAVQVYKEAHMTELLSCKPARPNVVMMDINMPVLDGYEATRRIRAYEQDCSIKPSTIVALTGLGSADAQREAYSCGFDLFLTKPVQLKKLTSLLESLKTGRRESMI